MSEKCDIVFGKASGYEGRDMKAKWILSLLMLSIILTMTACQKSEETENMEVKEEQTFIPTCEIIESSEVICDKPVKTGIYTEYSEWEKAVKGTDIEVVLDMKEKYDETFFKDKALVYLAESSSGGAQLKYEGYEIDDFVLYVNMSSSTDLLVNKLHSYFVFFTMDKGEAEKLDRAEFNVFSRD